MYLKIAIEIVSRLIREATYMLGSEPAAEFANPNVVCKLRNVPTLEFLHRELGL